MNKEIAPRLEVFQNEQDAWKKVLGIEVDIQPLPASITPEVKKNLEKMGMELRFIPSLNLGTLEDLQSQGTEKFLNDLQHRYPNWKNLPEWYWESVKDEKIDFPKLPGNWVAVETMPKPADGDRYALSKVSERLGFEDRFNITWNDIDKTINREKGNILNDVGLCSGDARMLEAIEWNLLGKREGWGETNTYEWTNTKLRDFGDCVAIGDSILGGAAHAIWFRPDRSIRRFGFRLAIVFNSPC